MHGLINFDQISKCKITTDKFTLLPKSPASGVSTLVHQIKPIFVLDSEWIKVKVKFDNRKKDVLNQQEPNPWQNMDIISNHEEEVRLFGSHTILVHSVTMFFVVIIVMIMLSICVANCLRYTSTHLEKRTLSICSGLHSLGEGDIESHIAHPKSEVLSSAKDTPVS